MPQKPKTLPPFVYTPAQVKHGTGFAPGVVFYATMESEVDLLPHAGMAHQLLNEAAELIDVLLLPHADRDLTTKLDPKDWLDSYSLYRVKVDR